MSECFDIPASLASFAKCTPKRVQIVRESSSTSCVRACSKTDTAYNAYARKKNKG